MWAELKICLASASPYNLTICGKSGGFGGMTAWIVFVITWSYCVSRLSHFPPQIFVNGTPLDQFGLSTEFLDDLELWLAKARPQSEQVGAARF